MRTDTTNVVPLHAVEERTYHKIARNGERFWIDNVDKGLSGTLYGKVANHLQNEHPYKYDDLIEYQQSEVVDEYRP